MIFIDNKEMCCGCQACLNSCPKKCITMVKDDEGFLYPKIDAQECINCGLCEAVCPFNKTEPVREKKPLSYAAKILDDEVRNQSSSGGIFSILADDVLEADGVVYGVAFSDDLRSAHHIRVDNQNELYKLRRSKYFQASTDEIYKSVREDLTQGKRVLFTGVPCQINGLKLFLRKNYENLLTAEVICHGTPSPKLWKVYVDYLENKYDAKVEVVNFREKRNGWKRFGLSEDGKNISQYLSLDQDPYMQMFLRNYCLRPSCYNCKAKALESMADLTIADFWGIQNIAPEMDDDKGTSLVIIHSENGKNAFEKLASKYICKEVPFEAGIESNPSYYQSVKRPTERTTFFVDLNSISFDELKQKYCKPIKTSFIRRCLRFVKRVIKKLFFKGGVNNSKFEYGLFVKLKLKK